MSDEGSIDVTDFQFAPLQRSRLVDRSSIATAAIQHDGLAVSSKYQIGIACCSANSLVSFSTSQIHKLRTNRDNVNKEFADLKRKTVALDACDVISGLSINCDGSLLAVLISNPSGAFVYIYDVTAFSLDYKGDVYHNCAVRIGPESTAKGCALQWNPAIPDHFAASASDNTVIVVKVDQTNLSSYCMIGSKRLGAAVNVISWSPKGKQLVVGDAVGKIAQLKPELEVVRVTMPPEIATTATIKVCGLCWLATTDWLVSYAVEGQTDIHPYLLILKKNTPASWQPLSDLSYGLAQSRMLAHLSTDASLLLSWNLVLTSSAKASEISVVGKRNESWKVWSLDDDCRCDLPTDSQRQPTFPLGMAIDLSSTTQVALSEDGSSMFRPSPILLVLTTDGVLVAQNVIYHDSAAPDCQVQPVPVDVNSIRVGKRPPGSVPPPSTPSIVQPAAQPAASQQMTPASTALPATPSPAKPPLTKTLGVSSLSSNTLPVAVSSTPTASLIGSGSKAAPVSSLFSSPASNMPQPTVTSSTPAAPEPVEKNEVPPPAQVVPEPAGPTREQLLKERKREVNQLLEKMKTEFTAMKTDAISLQTALVEEKSSIEDTDNFLNSENASVMSELMRMNEELETSVQFLHKEIKRGFGNATEKMEIAEVYEDDKSRIKILKKKDDFDRDERMRRLVVKMDSLKEDYARAKKMLETAKKSRPKKGSNLVSAGLGQDSFTRQQTKAVGKALHGLRWKLDSLSDEILKLEQKKRATGAMSDSSVPPKQAAIKAPPTTVNVLKCEVVPNPAGDILAMREKMRALMLKKSKEVPKPRNIVSLPFANDGKIMGKEEKKSEMSIIDRLKQMSTPRAEKPSPSLPVTSPKCDASTQADAQPVVVVQQVHTPTVVPKADTVVPQKPAVALQPAASIGTQKPAAATSSLFDAPKPVAKSLFPSATPVQGSSIFGTQSKPTPSIAPQVSVGTTPSVPKVSERPVNSEQPVEAAPTPAAVDVSTSKAAGSIQPTASQPPAEKKIEEVKVESSVKESDVTPKKEEEKPAAPNPTEAKVETSAPSSIFGGAKPAVGKSLFGGNLTPTTTSAAPAVTKPDEVKTTDVSSASSEPTTTASTSNVAKTENVEEKKETPKSIFGGSLTANTDTTPKSSPSIFGGGSTATATGSSSSPFGSFGQQPAATSQVAQPTAAAFSFKKDAAPTPQPTAAAFSFAPKTGGGGASSGFAAAAAKAVEDGMMEDDMGSSEMQEGTGNKGAGAGFMSGLSLGGAPSAANANKNVFGGLPTGSQPAQSKQSWLFGGAKPAAAQHSSGGGIFGGSQPAVAKPSAFGAAAAQAAAQQQQNTPVFGGAPKFGAAPSFGAKPSFGGGSPFGSSPVAPAQQQKSVFGGGASSGGGGFAAFAGKASFGGGASSQSTGSSIFGGGVASTPKPTSSVFGGGTQKTNAFNTWR